MKVATLSLLFALSAGCVLADPADQYPFRPKLEFSGSDGGANNQNNLTDLPEVVPPRLIFTEILIDAPGEDASFVERGEYIEIKNIGEGPADPRNITMFLNDLNDPLVGDRIEVATAFTPEEREVVDGLQLMEEGDYFVFVRHEDETVAPITATVAEGYSYDYGRYANGPTLPHQATSRRRLTIGYRFPNGASEIYDILEWEGHELLDTISEPTNSDVDAASDPPRMAKPLAFREGEAVGVDDNWETMSGTDDPQNWCVPPVMVGEVSGTPGQVTECP